MNMIHTPGTPPAPPAQSRGIPPLFKADTVNIAVSASKDGKLRVSTADRTTRRSSSERLRPDPAWRPQSDRQARALPVTSGEGGSLSPHRYASREVLLGPVDET